MSCSGSHLQEFYANAMPLGVLVRFSTRGAKFMAIVSNAPDGSRHTKLCASPNAINMALKYGTAPYLYDKKKDVHGVVAEVALH